MAFIFQRYHKWWIKLRRPDTGEIIRESLETHDRARAELLREQLELQAALRDPRFKACAIPDRLRTALGIESLPSAVATTAAVSVPAPMLGFSPVPMKRTSLDEAVKAYLRFISADNAPPHVANKISILRRFIGDDRVEKAGGPSRPKTRKGKKSKNVAPFFKGEFLDEITPVMIQEFIEGMDVKRITMRHYREFFSHFFSVCLKLGLYQPTNWHSPNPAAALPSYHDKNRRIAFLTDEQIQGQLDALKDHPDLRLAVAIMVYAGLRRSETLWLTEQSIADDLTHLSVLNRVEATGVPFAICLDVSAQPISKAGDIRLPPRGRSKTVKT